MAPRTRKESWHRAMKELECRAKSLLFLSHIEGLLKGFLQKVLNLPPHIWTLELSSDTSLSPGGKDRKQEDGEEHQGLWLLFEPVSQVVPDWNAFSLFIFLRCFLSMREAFVTVFSPGSSILFRKLFCRMVRAHSCLGSQPACI